MAAAAATTTRVLLPHLGRDGTLRLRCILDRSIDDDDSPSTTMTTTTTTTTRVRIVPSTTREDVLLELIFEENDDDDDGRNNGGGCDEGDNDVVVCDLGCGGIRGDGDGGAGEENTTAGGR